MKKILSIILIVTVLSLGFIVSVSAVLPPKQEIKYATFSDDFQKMFYNGNPYSRANTNGIYLYVEPILNESGGSYVVDNVAEVYFQGELSDEQKKTVDFVSIYSYDNQEVIFDVEIYYKDGSNLNVSYIRNDYLNEYNQLINKEFDEFYVDFTWPEGNTVPINKDVLSSPITKEFDYYPWYDDCFYVEGSITDGKLRYSYGEIRYINGDFYYYNPELNKEVENYFNSDSYIYGEYSYSYESEPKITLNKITDEATLATLNEGLQKYYDDEMGYMYNDELLEGVSKVFLTILFAIIPFAAFVIFLVLAIKAKKKGYKKIYITGCILSVAEIATFIAAAIYLFK